jgi:Kef-type K+ transport system membrane component KefB
MTAARVLLDVAVILVAAWAGGRLFERVGQPAVIGEIAAGVALGPTLLGALPGDPAESLFPADARTVLTLIGQLGLALFMFTVGWDLNLKLVRRREAAAAAVSVLSMLLPFALGLGLAVYLHPEHGTVGGKTVPFGPFALFIGAALAMTAFPVLARILNELRLSATPLGALVLTAAAIDDVVGWTILAVALAVLEASSAWEYVRMVVECVAFVVVVLYVVRPLLRRVTAPALVVPIALGGAYVTDAIGIHAVFGAFLVGVAMPRPQDDEARRALAAAVAVLAPIYFVMSGMAVDIPGLRAGDLAAFALILAAASAGKFFGAYAGARLARIPRQDASAIGVLMNTRGLIEIVLLTVGRDRGLIDGRLFTLFALMAIATTLLTSPALRRLRRPGTRAVLETAGSAPVPR